MGSLVYADVPVVLSPIVVTDKAEGYFVSESSTATRLPADVLEVPYSLGVFNAALLQDSQALRLEDLAPLLSGVQSSSADSGLNADLNIRGFSTSGSTYLNGLLDNQRFQVRDMALIERTEILKGQSSVLYGTGNPGGTVNYISKRPQAKMQHTASVSAATGSGDAYLGRLVLDSTGPVTANNFLLFRMIAAGQLANEFRANIANDRATLAPSLSWQYSDTGSVNLDFEYSYQNQPFRFDNVYTLGQVVHDKSYVDPRAQSDRDNWRVSAALQQQLWQNWSLQVSSQYFHVARHDVLLGFNTFVTPNTLSAYYRNIHDQYDQLSVRGEVHGDFQLLGSRQQVIAGVGHNFSDARLDSLLNVGGFKLDVFQPDFNHALPNTKASVKNTLTHELGFYATDKMDITRYWHISGGLRYSTFDALLNQKPVTDQHALAFNAGLSFTPTRYLASYFGYSQSFAPNTGITREHSFLPAKQGELLEFGIKGQLFEQRLGISSAVYQLTQDNLSMTDPSDKDYVLANGKVQSKGLELDVTGQVSERFAVIANYSWIGAQFVQHDTWQGNSFRSTPKHSGALWGKYHLPIAGIPGKLHLGAGLFFVGRRFGDDKNSFQVAGYIRPDLFAHYQWHNLDFNLKVENLLDKRYVSSSNFDDTVIQGNRLLIRGTVQVSFF